jgi:hypothetical protein
MQLLSKSDLAAMASGGGGAGSFKKLLSLEEVDQLKTGR